MHRVVKHEPGAEQSTIKEAAVCVVHAALMIVKHLESHCSNQHAELIKHSGFYTQANVSLIK